METFTQAGLAALFIAFAPAAASASVIVDTGTPANSSENWSLFGESIPPSGQYLAARFELRHATVLTSLEGYFGGCCGTLTLSVASDSGGDPSTSTPLANLYEEQTFSAGGDGAWAGVHGVRWALDAGTYWIEFAVDPDHGDTLTGNMPNNASNPLLAYGSYSVPGDAWAREDDLGFGVRIDSVPEPATWALMIGGFGLAGAALRQGRRRGQGARA